MLKIRQLTVFDRAIPILTNVSLEIKRGEIVAVVGPNNSGKSAMLETIAGGIKQFEGEIRVGSYSLKNEDKAKTQIGYLASPVALESYLTGLEWLEVVGTAYHLAPAKRIENILALAESLSCKDDLYTIIDNTDESVRQKIGLIAAVLHRPPVQLLDEPISNLDPTAQQEVSMLIRQMASEGAAILLATNNLGWVEQVAEKFVILTAGEIVAEGSLSQLKNVARSDSRALNAIYHNILDGQ